MGNRHGRGGANRVNAAERQAHALYLLARGYTYDEIASALGVAKATAHRIAQAGLERTVAPMADEYRTIQNRQLDALTRKAMRILDGNHPYVHAGRVVYHAGQALQDDGPKLAAITTLVRLMERRARLNGLDAQPTADPTMDAILYAIQQAEAERDRYVSIIQDVDGGHAGPPPSGALPPPGPQS